MFEGESTERTVPFLRKSNSLTIESGMMGEWRRKRSNPGERLNLKTTPIISEEGFEIVKNELPGMNTVLKQQRKGSLALAPKNEAQSQNRARKFSWEEVDDMDTAEYISNRLIKNLLIALYKTDSIDTDLLPNLADFEFFIKNLQYLEFIQNYHESIDHAKLKKITSSLMLSGSSTSISMPMSSTSIYLSHASTTQLSTPPTTKKPINSISIGRNSKGETKILNSSTWVKSIFKQK